MVHITETNWFLLHIPQGCTKQARMSWSEPPFRNNDVCALNKIDNWRCPFSISKYATNVLLYCMCLVNERVVNVCYKCVIVCF